MGNMHPTFAAALAPFAPPPLLNDDDMYVINLRTRTVVERARAYSLANKEARDAI